MLSTTSQYALRAIIYLAQHETDWPIPGSEIANKAGVPVKYLAKILGDLTREGVLDASRGKGGGFRLARSSQEIKLVEVLAPYERFDGRQCPFDNKKCSDRDPCLAHNRWKKVMEQYQRFLGNTSVASVAFEKRAGL
jgi:Rrf2 family iron-sulfur cluster assembly transcriptional regulator